MSHQRRPRNASPSSPWSLRDPSNAIFACISVLAVVTIANVIFALHTTSVLNSILPSTPHVHTYIGEDHPSQLPVELPSVGLELESGEGHFSLYDDDDWGTLFPSDGFVALGPNNRTFLVSLYHQFHCLDVIRVGYVVNRTHAAEHIQHCLRYLRQALLCHADTTLEVDIPQISKIDGKLYHTANGVGSVHRCRDWTVLRQYMLDHPSIPFE
ncbi:hypothetical protein K503DRAFT_693579 [Rhizopogon vinicolor AM-OR11-026]|uniref:Uncharacterized protein n=1 Tax=Rhizopogon vinicolor AM-OR11-026 TaxID=1314800 RepID=A0A1B7MXL2_9AGAM|nr:hypothetical protein K503DRAFT_693579 [Rhizopogon vinicolor AM-OR11-026]